MRQQHLHLRPNVVFWHSNFEGMLDVLYIRLSHGGTRWRHGRKESSGLDAPKSKLSPQGWRILSSLSLLRTPIVGLRDNDRVSWLAATTGLLLKNKIAKLLVIYRQSCSTHRNLMAVRGFWMPWYLDNSILWPPPGILSCTTQMFWLRRRVKFGIECGEWLQWRTAALTDLSYIASICSMYTLYNNIEKYWGLLYAMDITFISFALFEHQKIKQTIHSSESHSCWFDGALKFAIS